MKVIFLVTFFIMLTSYFILGEKFDFSKKYSVSDIKFIPNIDNVLTSSFLGLDGKVYKISEIVDLDQQIIIHFWASWCGPCLDELPNLYSYSEKLFYSNKRISVIYIAINDQLENVQRFLTKLNLRHNSYSFFLLDNNNTSYKTFRVDKVPESFILRNGKLERLVGPQSWK